MTIEELKVKYPIGSELKSAAFPENIFKITEEGRFRDSHNGGIVFENNNPYCVRYVYIDGKYAEFVEPSKNQLINHYQVY